MGAYLMAFSGDPPRMMEYECKVLWGTCSGMYHGQVHSREKWQVKKLLAGSKLHCWEFSDAKVEFSGQSFATSSEAGNDAREWCRRNGIVCYRGPALSGQIG